MSGTNAAHPDSESRDSLIGILVRDEPEDEEEDEEDNEGDGKEDADDDGYSE